MEEKIFNKSFSYLGVGAKLTGELHFRGPTRLSGHVEGTIHVHDGGRLIIERDSHIKGDIHCAHLEVFGNFQGKINCTGKITVHSCANVKGNIQTDRIVVYPGAILNIEGSTALS